MSQEEVKALLLRWLMGSDDYFRERLLVSQQSAVNNWAYYTTHRELGVDAKRRLKHELEEQVGQATFGQLFPELVKEV